MPDATPSPEERARELLAAEYERVGALSAAANIRRNDLDSYERLGIRALTAALTPSQPDTSAGEVGRLVEKLGEKLFALSDRLRRVGALNSDNVHAAYEAVVAAFQALDDASLSTPSAGEGLVLVPREESYAEFQQKRGRLPDLIEEALEIYRGFMLDDDYDPYGCLRKIVAKLENSRDFYDAAPANPSLSGTGEVERLREALPAVIGRLHLGERLSEGNSYCSHCHDVTAGHPLYWPERMGEYPDDMDPLCLEHAIEQAVFDNGYYDGDYDADDAALRPTNGSTEQ